MSLVSRLVAMRDLDSVEVPQLSKPRGVKVLDARDVYQGTCSAEESVTNEILKLGKGCGTVRLWTL
jgi:hypothetical protein